MRGKTGNLMNRNGPLALFALSTIAACATWQATNACAAEFWVDTRVVGPFVCKANFSLEKTGPLLKQLADMQKDLLMDLKIPPAKEDIELLLFRDEWTYRSYLRRNLPDIPYRRALFVKRSGLGVVLIHCGPNLGTDLRHECTHALLRASLPMLPLWLDEGLAGYYEMPPKRRAYDNPHAKNLRWNLRLSDISSVEQMETLVDFEKMQGADYRDSWAWVHFMLHGSPDAHDELVKYLAEIETGRQPGKLSLRLAKRLPDPVANCSKHHRNWIRDTRTAAK